MVKRSHIPGRKVLIDWDALERAFGKEAVAQRATQNDETSWRESTFRSSARAYGLRAGSVVIIAVIILGIVFAPLGMDWISKTSRDWTVLGNVGQAYGGVSALISAIALTGVVGSLLLQARQHSLDRITAVRGRQAALYHIVREDPNMYWPIMGGVSGDESSVKRWTFSIELLAYVSASFETGLLTEEGLRIQIFSGSGYFRYEENRQFWAMASKYWVDASSTRRRRKFVKIANEELARVRATGPGLVLPPCLADRPQRLKSRQGLHFNLSAFLSTAAVCLALLNSRRRCRSGQSVGCRSDGGTRHG